MMMKYFLYFLTACILFGFQGRAQETDTIYAITETGDRVILYPDNSWLFIIKDKLPDGEIPINKKEKFKKKTPSNYLLKSDISDLVLQMDTTTWEIEKSEEGETDTEYFLAYLKEDAEIYALVMTSTSKYTLEDLVNHSFTTIAGSDPEVALEEVEYRTVNNKEVIMMQIAASSTEFDFVYLGYYFVNEKGSNQIITFTTRDFFPSAKKQMLELLNGLDTQ